MASQIIGTASAASTALHKKTAKLSTAGQGPIMQKSFPMTWHHHQIPFSSSVQAEANRTIKQYMGRSRNCDCLVTWFCYQLKAKPGNKTAAVLSPVMAEFQNLRLVSIMKWGFAKFKQFRKFPLSNKTVSKMNSAVQSNKFLKSCQVPLGLGKAGKPGGYHGS